MSQHSYESLSNDLNYIDINKKAFKTLWCDFVVILTSAIV